MKLAHLVEKTKGGLVWFLAEDFLVAGGGNAVLVRDESHFLPEHLTSIKGGVQGDLSNTIIFEVFLQHSIKEGPSARELEKHGQITDIGSGW